MEHLLARNSTRKLFYTITLLVILVLFIIRFYVISQWGRLPDGNYSDSANIANSIVDNLIASFFVTIVVGSFYFWLLSIGHEQKVEMIASNLIEEELSKSRFNTEFWYFSGSTGRYTRAKSIPEIAKMSRAQNSRKFFTIVVLNPDDKVLCYNYADYRAGLKTAKNSSEWTELNVRKECYATILACAVWKTKEPLIEINLGLTNCYSLFRIDMGKSSVIVTRENPQEPAIVAYEGMSLYKFYKDEFYQIYRQSKHLNLLQRFVAFESLTVVNVKELFNGLNFSNDLTDDDITSIIEKAKKSQNPYD